MENKLSYRMYGFVPYNLSEIQKGIQFGHAVVEYSLQHGKTSAYKEWSRKHKTFIILNGGPTNQSDQFGMLKILRELMDRGITIGCFEEPDLNDALTAIVFVVDSRTFDMANNRCKFDSMEGFTETHPDDRKDFLQRWSGPTTAVRLHAEYDEWIKSIGGKKNEFMRYYLPKFRLA